MFWIVLAAQVSAATVAGNQGGGLITLFSANDSPAYLQIDGVSRIVHTRTVVRPDGTIQGCSVDPSSGDTWLDAFTCKLIVRRAKFVPAKWSDGTPVYGVVRVPVTWAVGSPPERKYIKGGLNVTLKQLPMRLESPYFQGLVFGVDEGAKVVSCGAGTEWHPGMDKINLALVSIACDQLTKSFAALPVKDDSGRLVRSVQNASVRFER